MDSTKGNSIISVAIKEIGYTEYPKDSNKTKYGKWFGFDGVRWCGTFASWCYAQAGYQLPNIGFTKGFAGCQTAVKYFKSKGKIVKTPQAGDLVFFDWNKDGRYDHVGIYEKPIGSDKFSSIEGNTSLNNQSNGGQVMRRKRDVSKAIFVRP